MLKFKPEMSSAQLRDRLDWIGIVPSKPINRERWYNIYVGTFSDSNAFFNALNEGETGLILEKDAILSRSSYPWHEIEFNWCKQLITEQDAETSKPIRLNDIIFVDDFWRNL